jgi:hypothetical protein
MKKEQELIKLTEFQFNKLVENNNIIDGLKSEIARYTQTSKDLIKFMLDSLGIDSDKFEYKINKGTRELELVELKEKK